MGVAGFHFVLLALLVLGCSKESDRALETKTQALAVKTTATVERLPDIVEFRIVGKHTVFLKTKRPQLYRLTADGGLYADRYVVNAETGDIRENPAVRSPNEITLSVGEKAQDSLYDSWNTLSLVEVGERQAMFRHTGIRRSGTKVDRLIIVTPYRDGF